ncbi:MAG: decaprenyl-phosphate phosphoribosyltransferase [Clostridia bacterium]|nr:decaprenyl-phosphate phosphoribosyltransferase [Clostridia bacterium]
MKKYFKQMRVKHYIKNMLIFLPIAFSGKMFDFNLLTKVVVGFVTFSLLASVVYIINDICDIAYDQCSNSKKLRPIAAGKISIKQAKMLAILLVVLSIITNLLANNMLLSWIYLVFYFIINLAYSFGLKNIPLIDISIIVTGFIIRVLFGGAIIGVNITNWMYLTVMAMSFYLAFGKRRNEIRRIENNSRLVLKHYTESFLDKMMYVSLTLTLVFYSLWCVSPSNVISSNDNLIMTVPIVLLICMKYSMLVENGSSGDPSEVLLGNKSLMLLVLLYGIFLLNIIY